MTCCLTHPEEKHDKPAISLITALESTTVVAAGLFCKWYEVLCKKDEKGTPSPWHRADQKHKTSSQATAATMAASSAA